MCEKKLSYTVFGVRGKQGGGEFEVTYIEERRKLLRCIHWSCLFFPGAVLKKRHDVRCWNWRARARSFLPVRPTFFFLRVFHGWNRVECIIHPSYVCYVYNIFILVVCRFLVLCSRAGRLRSSTLQTGLRQRVPIPGPPESWSRNQNRRTPQDDEVHSSILLFLLLLFLRVYIMGKPEWHKQNKTNRNK